MPDLRESLGDAILSGLCNTLNLSENLGQLGSRLWGSLGASAVSDAGLGLARGFGAAADVVCGRQPRDVESTGVPGVPGGQCVGAPYAVSWQATTVFGTFDGTTAATGPVSIRSEMDGDTFRCFVISNTGQSGEQELQVFAQNLGSPPDTSANSFVILSTLRTDGLPDDCGDGPVTPPEYQPSNFSPTLPINYDDPNGDPQSFNLPVVFGPGDIDADGNFIVPVVVNFAPGVNINGNINLNTGDFNFNSGGDGAPVEIPEDEPVPDGASLVGIRIVFAQESAERTRANERLGAGSAVPIWLPRLAAVRFEYESDGTRGWGPSKFAQTLDSVIWAERPAKDYNVTVERTNEYEVRKIIMNPDLFFNGGSGPGN